jgi:hypothetical protein
MMGYCLVLDFRWEQKSHCLVARSQKVDCWEPNWGFLMVTKMAVQRELPRATETGIPRGSRRGLATERPKGSKTERPRGSKRGLVKEHPKG